jgi:glucokinase
MPFAGKHPYPTLIAAALGNEAGLVGVADLARV